MEIPWKYFFTGLVKYRTQIREATHVGRLAELERGRCRCGSPKVTRVSLLRLSRRGCILLSSTRFYRFLLKILKHF